MNALFSSPVSLFAVSPGLTIGLIVSTRNQPWRLVPVDKLWTARGNQTAVLTGSAENMANLRCVSKNVATIGRRCLLKACRLIGCVLGEMAPRSALSSACAQPRVSLSRGRSHVRAACSWCCSFGLRDRTRHTAAAAPGIWCAPAERLTTANFSGCGHGAAKSGFRHFPQQGGRR